MYNHYYVNTNAQSNGDHEVHREDCSFLPAPGSRLYLGLFEECFSAVAKARPTPSVTAISGPYS